MARVSAGACGMPRAAMMPRWRRSTGSPSAAPGAVPACSAMVQPVTMLLRERVVEADGPGGRSSVTPKRLSDLSTGRRRVKYSPGPPPPRRPTHVALDLVRERDVILVGQRHRMSGSRRLSAIEEKLFAKPGLVPRKGSLAGVANRRDDVWRRVRLTPSSFHQQRAFGRKLRDRIDLLRHNRSPWSYLDIGTTTRWSAGPLVMESTRLTMRRRAVAVARPRRAGHADESKALRCARGKEDRPPARSYCVPISMAGDPRDDLAHRGLGAQRAEAHLTGPIATSSAARSGKAAAARLPRRPSTGGRGPLPICEAQALARVRRAQPLRAWRAPARRPWRTASSDSRARTQGFQGAAYACQSAAPPACQITSESQVPSRPSEQPPG